MPCSGSGYNTVQNSQYTVFPIPIGHPCHVEVAIYEGIATLKDRVGGVDLHTWNTNVVIFDTQGDTTLIVIPQTNDTLYFQVVSTQPTPTPAPTPASTPQGTPSGFSTPPPTQTLTVTVPESGGFDIALVILAITAFIAFWKYIKRIVI